jgi:hypothetical protein
MRFLMDLLTARELGEGFFGGAEGALRFLCLCVIASLAAVVFWII